jgi:hypothetical protein
MYHLSQWYNWRINTATGRPLRWLAEARPAST